MRRIALFFVIGGCLPQLPDLADPCGPWPDPGLYRLKVDEPGPLRKPYVYVPSTAEGPRDVVYLLHGAGGTGPKMEESTEFEKLADEEGFVLVYPNGLGWPTRTWNAGYGFDDDHDDVKFLDDLAADVTEKVCAGRSFATGFSNGAMMTHRWACEGKAAIEAISPVSGVLLVDDCARPMPVRHYHGTADKVVRVEGGKGTVLRDVSFPSVDETMAIWRGVNGCSDDPPEVTTEGDTTCTAWKCGTPTEMCLIEGWDHHWPGGIYSAKTDADATGEIWSWFGRVAPEETGDPTDAEPVD